MTSGRFVLANGNWVGLFRGGTPPGQDRSGLTPGITEDEGVCRLCVKETL